MQCHYRCDDETGRALSDAAAKRGISRNDLLNEICLKYLKKAAKEPAKADRNRPDDGAKAAAVNAAADAIQEMAGALLELREAAGNAGNSLEIRAEVAEACAAVIGRLDRISAQLSRL